MAKTGTLVKTDGTATAATAKGQNFDLREFYALVECGTVEHVKLGKHDLWIDEEGKLARKAINPKLTMLASAHGHLSPLDVIVGHGVVTPALGSHAKGCKVCAAWGAAA